MLQQQLMAILRARGYGAAALTGLLGAVALLLMTRSVIQHAPHYDELLHVLSARGLLESGTLSIADGLYTRAQLFTRAVAWSMRLFGDSLESARLPALAAAVALVALIGAWITRTSGLLAGAAAAAFLCSVPMTAEVAVFARFYSAHALVIALMFIAVFEALQPSRPRRTRVALWTVAVLLVPLAWHLQEITVIALGALAAGAIALLLLDSWTQVRSTVIAHPVLTLGGLAVAGIAGLTFVWHFELLDRLGYAALWAADSVGRVQFYLVGFREELPLLWPLLPLAAALAIAAPEQRRIAIFCVVCLGAALFVHSIAGQKAMRYVFYVVPWIAIILGCAAASVISQARDWAGVAREPRFAALGILLLLGVGLVFSNEGTRALNLAAGRLSAIDSLPFSDEPDWGPAVPALAQRVRDADRVVASNSMKALFFFGRYDFELSATIVPETDTGDEFGRDERTGGQAIGTAESIETVLNLPGTALVVLEKAKIGIRSGVVPAAFALVEARCNELALAAEAAVRAWSCVRP